MKAKDDYLSLWATTQMILGEEYEPDNAEVKEALAKVEGRASEEKPGPDIRRRPLFPGQARWRDLADTWVPLGCPHSRPAWVFYPLFTMRAHVIPSILLHPFALIKYSRGSYLLSFRNGMACAFCSLLAKPW